MKSVVLLLVALGVCGVSIAQRTDSGNRNACCSRSERSKTLKRSLNQSERAARNKSVVRSLFITLARDTAGEIWAGGSLLLSKGLLLHSTGSDMTATSFPEVQRIEDLAFAGPNKGWMIAGGHLFRTSDAGWSWQKTKLNAEPEFRSLSFSDEQHGWAAGWRGVIYHTDDGGASWHQQDSGTTLDLWKIFFVDGMHGWATGGRSTDLKWRSVLLATTDGGTTWKRLNNESDLTLHDVMFVDEDQGWGLDMRKKVIVHTNDGGATWAAQVELENSYDSIFFLNREEGWVVGDAVVHTDDGGQTWNVKTADDFAYSLKKAIFADSLRGWAIGDTHDGVPRVLSTSDAGRTWGVISNNWEAKLVGGRLRERAKQ
jgi:photosystem II stability/assembly factor-like uncharacterized protein